MNFNFIKICQSLLDGIQDRAKEVIQRRYGLSAPERETLESIGESFGITRERVRQIQERALKQIRDKNLVVLKEFGTAVFTDVKKSGGLMREDLLLDKWGGQNFQNHALFLISLSDGLLYSSEDKNYHAFWYMDGQSVKEAKKIVEGFIKFLNTKKQPVKLADYKAVKISPEELKTYLSISKDVLSNAEGFYGLDDWPEINPKNIRDKAYLVLKKNSKPLHFSEIYSLIANKFFPEEKNVLLQSVHNELIRNPEFVLIGRGIYALKDWGYQQGWVKDILTDIIKKEEKPITKEELIKKVMDQRQVKKSTILLNLSNKSYFLRNTDGKYTLKC